MCFYVQHNVSSVNAQSCVCGAGIFSPVISRAAGAGRSLRSHGVDKDAVCGPLLGVCVASWGRRPAPAGVWEVIFICLLPQCNLANTGASRSCFYCWLKSILVPSINHHSGSELTGFLIGELEFLFIYLFWFDCGVVFCNCIFNRGICLEWGKIFNSINRSVSSHWLEAEKCVNNNLRLSKVSTASRLQQHFILFLFF